MKKVSLILLLSISIFGYAQETNPVTWEMKLINNEDSTKTIRYTAAIEKNWQLYSNDFDPNLGPLVTVFKYTVSNSYDLTGPTYPKNSKRKYDDLWGGEYSYFEKHAEFNQSVKNITDISRIEVNIVYQVCNTIDGKCIPYDIMMKIKK